VNDEKSKLQTDIDRIEVQLDSANSVSVKLSEQMKEQQETARKKIAELRSALKKGQLTQKQLAEAQNEIKKLRDFVIQYTAEIEDLKKTKC
jgi:chromosome segregation ATPase